jgi:hypothetical protein
MTVDEGQVISGVEKPLRVIGEAFEKLTAILMAENDDLGVAQFSEAASLLSVLFGSLGIAFRFAEVEYAAKVRDLMEASKSFDTLPALLDHDVKTNSVRRAGSRSRNLLRVKQGMEMVKVLFEEILSTEGNSLREPASTAYARVLASSQGWAVRKAVAAGMYAIPTRAQLFKILKEDEESFRAQMQRYIAASTPVIQYVDHLFLARNLGIKW